MVPWARVMASLHWAALRYCRITERLIETNDSNNRTLSPQAGYVAGLISVVAARGTRHHADPSMEEAQVSFFPHFFFFSFLEERAARAGFASEQCAAVAAASASAAGCM